MRCLWLVWLAAASVHSDDILVSRADDPARRIHACSTRCHDKLRLNSNSVDSIDEDSTDKCQRGCRFYMIVRLIDESQILDLNSSLDACKSSCKESYAGPGEATACNMGCDINSLLKDQVPLLRSTTGGTGGGVVTGEEGGVANSEQGTALLLIMFAIVLALLCCPCDLLPANRRPAIGSDDEPATECDYAKIPNKLGV